MDDLGANSRDLRDLGIPHPTEHGLPDSQRETRIQLFGNISLWVGLTLITTDIITVLALSADDWPGWNDPVARQFAGLGAFLVGITAAALVTVGGVERLMRQSRALIRRAMGRADTNADIGQANRAAIGRAIESVDQFGKLVGEAVATLAGIEKRLLALEAAIEQVPDYGKGVIDGATMRANALGDTSH